MKIIPPSVCLDWRSWRCSKGSGRTSAEVPSRAPSSRAWPAWAWGNTRRGSGCIQFVLGFQVSFMGSSWIDLDLFLKEFHSQNPDHQWIPCYWPHMSIAGRGSAASFCASSGAGGDSSRSRTCRTAMNSTWIVAEFQINQIDPPWMSPSPCCASSWRGPLIRK